MEFKFYYNILGVSKDADFKEIRKAYRDLAKKLHSDMNVDKSKEEQEELENELKEASEAYHILKNPVTRKEYDLELIKEAVSQALKSQQSKREQQNDSEEKKSDNLKTKKAQKSVKDIYNEVKKMEEKNSFSKRHKKINKVYDEMYAPSDNTFSKNIIFHFEKGTVNVMHELYYQLKKLSYITEDSIPKYIFRNRKLVTTVGLAITLGVSFNNLTSTSTKESAVTEISTYTTETLQKIEDNDDYNTITLNKVHEIRMGETLSQIAIDSGNSENSLKILNNLPSSGLLHEGNKIIIPYEISSSNLQYYTSIIDTKSKSVYDLAKEYETDIKTLCELNQDAIINLSNIYIIITDKIIVPNFITKNELKALKETTDIKK